MKTTETKVEDIELEVGRKNGRRITPQRVFAVLAAVFLAFSCYKAVPQATASFGSALIGLNLDADGGLLKYFIVDRVKTLDNWQTSFDERAPQSLPYTTAIMRAVFTTGRMLGKRVTVDELYTTCLLDDGYLSYAPSKIDMTRYAENLIVFANSCKEVGSDFLFVLNPSKADGTEDMFPTGVVDYYAENKLTLFETIEKSDINSIDIAKVVREQGKDLLSLFYKTDHHWLPESGMFAAGVVADELNENYGYSFDSSLFDTDNYIVDSRGEIFYGSQGKKFGWGYTDAENFNLLLPKFETHFEYDVEIYDEPLIGTFSDTLINMRLFDNYEPAVSNAYGAYLYGDRGVEKIHNLDCDNGKRIVIFKTSLANVVIPVLACGDVEYIDVVDLRLYGESGTEYVQEVKPDTVIVMYGLPYYGLALNAENCSWNFN